METNDLVSNQSLFNNLKSAKHDLNNLLNNVLSAADLLSDKFSKDNTIEELTRQIQHNTILASKIISQIIPQSDIPISSFTKLNLNELILDTIKIIDRNLVKFEVFLPKEASVVLGDYTSLQRVLLNLIENAKDAKQKGLKIQIKLENSVHIDKNNYIVLTIIDNGSGIETEHINSIFDSGFTTKNDEGTQRGLGLSIVNKVVKKHNGFIDVSSRINSGTTFKIYFPVKNFIDNKKNFNDKNIIIAEDDKFQREVMSDLLKSMKIKVYTASNGIEALDLYYSIKPDILLIDDKMPGMTGIECINKIRENDKLAQIVLVTGSNEGNVYSKDDSIRVLNKPFNFDEIKNLLSELL